MEQQPVRRFRFRWPRFRFGTRTLFILFTLLSVGIGWGSLHFYRNYRHDRAMAAIREVGGRIAGEADGKVERVYLRNPDIDDAKLIELLAHLRYVRGMEELDLVELPITDEVAQQFYGLPRLQRLYLYQTDLSAQAVERIAKALPHVEVKLDKPDPVASGLAKTTIYRHAIMSLAVSFDGTQFVTGSGDGTLRWWSIHNLTDPDIIAAHKTWTFAAAYHPDGKRLVTGGGDNMIRVWDIQTHQQLAELAGHDDDVHALGFSPDGAELYSAGDDMTLRSWNLNDPAYAAEVVGMHDEQIPCLTVAGVSGEVLTGSRDETIGWWRPDSGERLRTLADHTGDVMSLALDAQQGVLASASYDGTVRIWDLANGRPQHVLSGHQGRVFHVALDSTGSRLASSGEDGVQVWDLEADAPLFAYAGARYVSTIAFANGDNWLLAADAEGFVHVIDTLSGKLYRKMATARAHGAGTR
ncbi:WD40 repeat domain-containing protein [Aeoliella sp. ICT_H6.2]|uniref:WD40 repeat domain-containing protein n=1 Tax=Aeoliella straminimaris TaxID=2954799 RepID=A0A9X2FF07_9BACT|nr:WD40 repeat domain-containing protein [Aeoliella straminimaris]